LQLRQRRIQVAKTAIVEVENHVELAPLQMEQRAMPPQMMQQVVGAGPVWLELAEPGDALVVPILHLHDMRNRVRGPEIGGGELDRRAAGRLRDRGGPPFLLGKTTAGKHPTPAPADAGPPPDNAPDRSNPRA